MLATRRQSRSEPIDLRSYEELPNQEFVTAPLIRQKPQPEDQYRPPPSKLWKPGQQDTDSQPAFKNQSKRGCHEIGLDRDDQTSHPFPKEAYNEAVAKIKHVKEKAPYLPHVQDVVDLCDSKHTTVERTWAPAVVHDVYTPLVHHASQHLVSRDVHEHMIRLRTLPIIDVQTLPPRHYVPGSDGHLKPIPAAEVQDRLKGNNQPKNWLIAETVSKRHTEPHISNELKRLLAEHKPPPQRISDSQHLSPEGYERRETTWVHGPTIERQERPRNQPSQGERHTRQMPKVDERRSYELDAEAAVANESSHHLTPSRHSPIMRPKEPPVLDHAHKPDSQAVERVAQPNKDHSTHALVNRNKPGEPEQGNHEQLGPIGSRPQREVYSDSEQQSSSRLQALSPLVEPRPSSPDKTRQHHHHFWHLGHSQDQKSAKPKNPADWDKQSTIPMQLDDSGNRSKIRLVAGQNSATVTEPQIVVTEPLGHSYMATPDASAAGIARSVFDTRRDQGSSKARSRGITSPDRSSSR
ncbi:MAG: hypothetical protein M1831_007459 [Alyxoria varia]|nr:MAG: hypothetical protein M1831_007459 [Alyxoria varia]